MTAIGAVVIICCILSFIFPIFHVYSNSMEPTILSGEYAVTFRFGEVAKGEAVVVPYDDRDDYLVKHVAALWKVRR